MQYNQITQNKSSSIDAWAIFIAGWKYSTFLKDYSIFFIICGTSQDKYDPRNPPTTKSFCRYSRPPPLPPLWQPSRRSFLSTPYFRFSLYYYNILRYFRDILRKFPIFLRCFTLLYFDLSCRYGLRTKSIKQLGYLGWIN